LENETSCDKLKAILAPSGSTGMENPAGAPASPLADTPLTPEQLGVVEAPIDEALAVLAAAGTGKTTTMVARTRFLLSKVGQSGSQAAAGQPVPHR
jgi:hypothetical protein